MTPERKAELHAYLNAPVKPYLMAAQWQDVADLLAENARLNALLAQARREGAAEAWQRAIQSPPWRYSVLTEARDEHLKELTPP